MNMHSPSHPGEIIREEIIAPLGLEVTQAAEQLQVARTTLSRLLNERIGLSPEMALRIEKAFGQNADHLIRMQTQYDMAQARKKAAQWNIEAYVSER